MAATAGPEARDLFPTPLTPRVLTPPSHLVSPKVYSEGDDSPQPGSMREKERASPPKHLLPQQRGWGADADADGEEVLYHLDGLSAKIWNVGGALDHDAARSPTTSSTSAAATALSSILGTSATARMSNNSLPITTRHSPSITSGHVLLSVSTAKCVLFCYERGVALETLYPVDIAQIRAQSCASSDQPNDDSCEVFISAVEESQANRSKTAEGSSPYLSRTGRLTGRQWVTIILKTPDSFSCDQVMNAFGALKARYVGAPTKHPTHDAMERAVVLQHEARQLLASLGIRPEADIIGHKSRGRQRATRYGGDGSPSPGLLSSDDDTIGQRSPGRSTPRRAAPTSNFTGASPQPLSVPHHTPSSTSFSFSSQYGAPPAPQQAPLPMASPAAAPSPQTVENERERERTASERRDRKKSRLVEAPEPTLHKCRWCSKPCAPEHVPRCGMRLVVCPFCLDAQQEEGDSFSRDPPPSAIFRAIEYDSHRRLSHPGERSQDRRLRTPSETGSSRGSSVRRQRRRQVERAQEILGRAGDGDADSGAPSQARGGDGVTPPPQPVPLSTTPLNRWLQKNEAPEPTGTGLSQDGGFSERSTPLPASTSGQLYPQPMETQDSPVPRETPPPAAAADPYNQQQQQPIRPHGQSRDSSALGESESNAPSTPTRELSRNSYDSILKRKSKYASPQREQRGEPDGGSGPGASSTNDEGSPKFKRCKWCGTTSNPDPDHEKKCSSKKVKCKVCGEQLFLGDRKKHAAECQGNRSDLP